MDAHQQCWQLSLREFIVLIVGRIIVHEGSKAVLSRVLNRLRLADVPRVNDHVAGRFDDLPIRGFGVGKSCEVRHLQQGPWQRSIMCVWLLHCEVHNVQYLQMNKVAQLAMGRPA